MIFDPSWKPKPNYEIVVLVVLYEDNLHLYVNLNNAPMSLLWMLWHGLNLQLWTSRFNKFSYDANIKFIPQQSWYEVLNVVKTNLDIKHLIHQQHLIPSFLLLALDLHFSLKVDWLVSAVWCLTFDLHHCMPATNIFITHSIKLILNSKIVPIHQM